VHHHGTAQKCNVSTDEKLGSDVEGEGNRVPPHHTMVLSEQLTEELVRDRTEARMW
jgi:hypothetical protein